MHTLVTDEPASFKRFCSVSISPDCCRITSRNDAISIADSALCPFSDDSWSGSAENPRCTVSAKQKQQKSTRLR